MGSDGWAVQRGRRKKGGWRIGWLLRQWAFILGDMTCGSFISEMCIFPLFGEGNCGQFVQYYLCWGANFRLLLWSEPVSPFFHSDMSNWGEGGEKRNGGQRPDFSRIHFVFIIRAFRVPLFLCIQTWGETHVCVGIGFPSFNTGSNLFFSGGTLASRRRIDINATDFFVRFPSFFSGYPVTRYFFREEKNWFFFLTVGRNVFVQPYILAHICV